ncbi:hypothetical protein AYI69_g9930 [Smittium culicis]|uniref:Uncharacterized protein n=1 Tax=Smittium culicis TaxID=133412 RepID=A0A1R1X970_9FUNG|nr:hypothetical protein AYI69_g9930 [Smittium culicis]
MESVAFPKSNSDGAAASDTTSYAQQEKDQSRGPLDPDRRSSIPILQKYNRGGQMTRSGILQQSLCHTKENRATQTSPRPDEIKYAFPRAPVWTVTQLPDFHQSPTARTNLSRSQGTRVSAYLEDLLNLGESREIRTREIFEYTEKSYHAFRDADQHAGHDAESSQIQGHGPKPGGLQAIKYRPNLAEELGELHRQSSSNVSGSALSTTNVTKAPRAKKHCTNYTEVLDGYRYFDRTCNP